VFVPKPGGISGDDGWLIGTSLDFAAGVSRLSEFYAGRPMVRWRLPASPMPCRSSSKVPLCQHDAPVRQILPPHIDPRASHCEKLAA